MTQQDPPKSGDPIQMKGGKLVVPERPVIPFIEGDGTGPDIWRAASAVLDASVEKAYGGKKKLEWYEVYAGEKAKRMFDSWLPDATVEAYRKYLVGIKGPLTTPVGKGHPLAERRSAPTARSLRVSASRTLVHERAEPRQAPG